MIWFISFLVFDCFCVWYFNLSFSHTSKSQLKVPVLVLHLVQKVGDDLVFSKWKRQKVISHFFRQLSFWHQCLQRLFIRMRLLPDVQIEDICIERRRFRILQRMLGHIRSNCLIWKTGKIERMNFWFILRSIAIYMTSQKLLLSRLGCLRSGFVRRPRNRLFRFCFWSGFSTARHDGK